MAATLCHGGVARCCHGRDDRLTRSAAACKHSCGGYPPRARRPPHDVQPLRPLPSGQLPAPVFNVTLEGASRPPPSLRIRSGTLKSDVAHRTLEMPPRLSPLPGRQHARPLGPCQRAFHTARFQFLARGVSPLARCPRAAPGSGEHPAALPAQLSSSQGGRCARRKVSATAFARGCLRGSASTVKQKGGMEATRLSYKAMKIGSLKRLWSQSL